MLADTTAVATVAAKDLAAARRFYGETLGLPELGRPDEEVTVYRSGNSTLNVYHSEFAGTNKATAVTWAVGDAFDSVVADLKRKGVRFERYDMPGVKMDGDVHVFDGNMRVVWFKDPDGNILNVINR
jgi:catechol 2,3-dioxygenase-like lactoylglutathione lyase family enzyme